MLQMDPPRGVIYTDADVPPARADCAVHTPHSDVSNAAFRADILSARFDPRERIRFSPLRSSSLYSKMEIPLTNVCRIRTGVRMYACIYMCVCVCVRVLTYIECQESITFCLSPADSLVDQATG